MKCVILEYMAFGLVSVYIYTGVWHQVYVRCNRLGPGTYICPACGLSYSLEGTGCSHERVQISDLSVGDSLDSFEWFARIEWLYPGTVASIYEALVESEVVRVVVWSSSGCSGVDIVV